MQFSTKIDGFEQKDSQGFENSYNSYEQCPLEKFFIFTIYQNYTLALMENWASFMFFDKYLLLMNNSLIVEYKVFQKKLLINMSRIIKFPFWFFQ